MTVGSRLALLALLGFSALISLQAPAAAQVVADQDFWKQAAADRDTVNRFVYSQSPQTIPPGYDPVREAEEILREKQRTLPASNPQARSLWQQIRGITVKSAVSTAPRALGTITLAAGTFELGWKIGSGINAKFLRIGVPEETYDPAGGTWDVIRWRTANYRSYYGARWPAEDGWVAEFGTDRWFDSPCPFTGFSPPEPFVVRGPVASTANCRYWDGSSSQHAPVRVLYAWAPENAFEALGPIEPYTNQPYDHSDAAPVPPPQSTVEQSIESELEKPENGLLRQWLNYQLGSPGERDPVEEGVNIPQPAAAPGDAAAVFVEELEELGLTNVKVEVLSDPEFDPAFDEGAVVRVSPPPGTSVEPGEEIVVTANRTAERQNNGECDRGVRQDPGPPPSGDEFLLTDTFSGRDPDQGMATTDVPFRWGTTTWGYRHVELGHGWDNIETVQIRRLRSTTQLQDLMTPAPISSTSSTWGRTESHARAESWRGSTCSGRNLGSVGSSPRSRILAGSGRAISTSRQALGP